MKKQEPNPPCDGLKCKVEETLRCSIIMPQGTDPKDALFVEDGVAYGITYFYCKKCIKKQTKQGRFLKVWSD